MLTKANMAMIAGVAPVLEKTKHYDKRSLTTSIL